MGGSIPRASSPCNYAADNTSMIRLCSVDTERVCRKDKF